MMKAPKALTDQKASVMGYKLSRNQKFVKMQDFYCMQMHALPTEAPLCGIDSAKGPGATTITNLSWVQKQKLWSPAMRDKLRDETPPWRDKNRDSLPRKAGTFSAMRETTFL
jgi:hypothetical protein